MWDVAWRNFFLAIVFLADLLVLVDLVRSEYREWRAARRASVPSAGHRPRRAASRSLADAKGLFAVAVVVVSCGWSWSVSARPVAIVDSYPMVDQIMDGAATSFALRFAEPIDHASARLILMTPQGPRSLRARLGSRPNTLFSAIGKLEPGVYSLTWRARSRDGEIATGNISFHVAPR